MKFLNIIMLLLLPLLLMSAGGLIAYAASKRKRALQELPQCKGVGGKVILSPFKRQLRYALLLLTVLFLSLTAARPWWGEIRTDLSGSGRDIVFVLDVSKSMLAEDIAPSRLTHAKFMIKELMKDNPRDRFALVAFSGAAMLSCPLTNDQASVELALDDVSSDSIPLGGTNVQEALKLVLKAFSGAEGNSRAVVMLSDGEELTGNAGSLLAQLKTANIPLFVLGIGSKDTGAMIPIRDDSGNVSYVRDAAGNLVQTRMNEELLSSLAHATGGSYFYSGSVNTGIKGLNAALKKIDTVAFENGKQNLPIERFMPFLALSVLGLLAFMMISERPARKVVIGLLAVLCSLNLAAQNMPDATDEPLPVIPAVEVPENRLNQELYRQGRIAQMSGDSQTARKKYEEALQLDGIAQEEVRRFALHNLGVMDHTMAREDYGKAKNDLTSQDLDGSLKKLDEALQKMSAAEEFYVNSMQSATNTTLVDQVPTAQVQQQLLQDRKMVEELKKQVEELKKQREEAQKQTQQAQKQNQQEQNQQEQNQQEQNQQEQNQQEQNQQEQNQQEQNQQEQNQQSATEQAAKDAENAAQQLKEMADKLGQQQLKEQAEKAEQELQKAQEKQQKKDYSGVQENLQNALDELQNENGGNEPEPDKSGDQGEAGDESKPEKDAGNKPQPQQYGDQQKENIDSKMADQLLDKLNQDERELRNQLRSVNMGEPQQAEKDW